MSETLRSGPPLAPTDGDDLVPAREALRPAGGGVSSWLPRGVSSWLRRQAQEPHIQLLLAQLCIGGGAALANVLMARALAPSGRGLIALLLQVSYLASQLLLLGSERSFVAVYHGSAPAAGVRAYAKLALGPCAAGLGVVAVTAVVMPSILRPPQTVLALIVAFTLVNVSVQAARAIAIATRRYTDLLLSSVASQLILLATLTVLLLTGVTRPSMWLVAYMLAGGLPTLACAIAWSRATDRSIPAEAATTPEDDKRRAVRREGLALFPAAVANMGMLRLDRLVLPALASTAALGLYATVSTLTELLAWPLQAYADTRLGRWRAAHGLGRLRVSPVLFSTAIYTVGVAPVFGGLVYLLVVPLFGERYAPAKALVVPLVAAAGLYAISRVSLGVLIGQGRNLLASAAEVSGFAASLVAYLVLIPAHGALGAAYGSLIGYGTCLVFAWAAVRARTVRPKEQSLAGDGR